MSLAQAIDMLAKINTMEMGFGDVNRVVEMIEDLTDMKERYGETI